jgi:hypothetical protein
MNLQVGDRVKSDEFHGTITRIARGFANVRFDFHERMGWIGEDVTRDLEQLNLNEVGLRRIDIVEYLSTLARSA